MTRLATDVAADVVVGRHRWPIAVELDWDTDDPLAVTMTAHPEGHDPAKWLIAREVLAIGLTRWCQPGGDVACGPVAGYTGLVVLRLTSPAGSCELLLDRDDVMMFLEDTFLHAPLGAETVDIDTLLADVLREETA